MKFGIRKLESWGFQAVKKIMSLAFFVFDTIKAKKRYSYENMILVYNT